jgi:hypothetical protein
VLTTVATCVLAVVSALASGALASADAPVRLAVQPAATWVVDPSFGPPDLAQTPQVTLTQWAAWRRGDAELVAACFRAPVGTWAPEIEPIALERIAAMATSTALRVRGDASLRPVTVARGERIVTQSFAGDAASARTFLAFVRADPSDPDSRAAAACFALCANGSCAGEIDRAELEGPLASPPPTSAALRALLAAIHHPRATAWAVVALACVAFAIAVMTRKRTRGRNPRVR